MPRTLVRILSSVTAAVAIALSTASSASATNFAPNPGFESTCGSPTKACSWPDFSNSFAEGQPDTSLARGGSTASYRVRLIGVSNSLTVRSDCIAPPPVSPGSIATVSFWYRTTDARVNSIRMVDTYWVNTTCGTSGTGTSTSTSAPVANGDWHQVSGQVLAKDGQSFSLDLGFTCSTSCPGAQVNFDDIVYDYSPPTAVRVMPVRAVRGRFRGLALTSRNA